MKYFWMIGVAFVLGGCVAPSYRNSGVAISSQAIDPARYAGLWYEIARFPVAFQRGCRETTAQYGVVDADTLSVVNTCRKGGPQGELDQVVGVGEITGPGQLKVSFDSVPFIAAHYWVLWVDDAYQTAVVGVPSGRAGWVLSRVSDPSIARQQQALQVLRANGYDTSKLIFTEH
jgi:apolipoprotein D and lipocalin family protein